jgi:voltage-gated potassium channel
MITTWHFVKHLAIILGYLSGVLTFLAMLIALGGVLLSYLDRQPVGKSLYLACITALTIGYGEHTPRTPAARVVCVALGLVGLVFSGIIVAVAVHATALALRDVYPTIPVPIP